MQLVLNSMGSEQRVSLARSLEKFSLELEIKQNPLVEDLVGYDERANLERLIHRQLSAVTAASSLTDAMWTSSERDFTVRVTQRCRDGAKHCFALESVPPRSQTEDRARFFAWPISHAIVLSTETDEVASQVVELLRAPQPDVTNIALALRVDDLHSTHRGAELLTIAEHARNICDLAGEAQPQLTALLHAVAIAALDKDTRDPLPWLQLSPGSVLVVPRLGVLAMREAFVREVRDRISAIDGRIRWLSVSGT